MEPLEPWALTTVERLGWMTGLRNIDPNKARFLINAYSQRIITLCSRARPFYTYTTDNPLILKGSGQMDIYVPNPPIKSISNLTINGITFAVQTVDNTVPFPIIGSASLIVYRRPWWDITGKLLCPFGYTMWAPDFRDLSGDTDLLYAHRLYNISVAMTGGYIVPQWSGVINATYNPTGAPSDFPRDLEKVICDEIAIQIAYPNRHLQSQRSPGGREQRWKERAAADETEFSPNSAMVIASYQSSRDR